MKRVKYDPNLPTILGGERMVKGTKLSQEALGGLIRTAAKPYAIEAMVMESDEHQTYQLSNGTLLRIWKRTGEVQTGDTTNR